MRFYLVVISQWGYRVSDYFDADSLTEAARIHVGSYKARQTPFALVMRGPDGKRYSFRDSSELLSAAA